MEDWGAVRDRLKREASDVGRAWVRVQRSDICAVLERVEDVDRLIDMAGDWIETDPSLRSTACIEVALDHAKELDAGVLALRQRVEELEREKRGSGAAVGVERAGEPAGTVEVMGVSMEDWGAVRDRLLAACPGLESRHLSVAADIRAALDRNAELEEMGRAWQESDEHKHADQLRQRVEDLEQQLAAEHGHSIQCEATVREAAALRQRVEELERDYAEVQDISVSESAGRRAAEVKLVAWQRAESLPDCPACAALEAEGE